jgi:polyisoprenoid-binding protein YceI
MSLHRSSGRWSAALLAGLAMVATTSLAATWRVTDGSEVVFESSAPLESFEGKTSEVRGHVGCDPGQLAGPCDLRIVVDLASLDTGIGLRNDHMRDRHLETDRFPEAEFVGTSIVAASSPALEAGESVQLTVRGRFALHGVTREREIEAVVTLADDGHLHVQAEFPVSLEAHEISRPGFLVMKLADEQKVRVALICTPEEER